MQRMTPAQLDTLAQTIYDKMLEGYKNGILAALANCATEKRTMSGSEEDIAFSTPIVTLIDFFCRLMEKRADSRGDHERNRNFYIDLIIGSLVAMQKKVRVLERPDVQ